MKKKSNVRGVLLLVGVFYSFVLLGCGSNGQSGKERGTGLTTNTKASVGTPGHSLQRGQEEAPKESALVGTDYANRESVVLPEIESEFGFELPNKPLIRFGDDGRKVADNHFVLTIKCETIYSLGWSSKGIFAYLEYCPLDLESDRNGYRVILQNMKTDAMLLNHSESGLYSETQNMNEHAFLKDHVLAQKSKWEGAFIQRAIRSAKNDVLQAFPIKLGDDSASVELKKLPLDVNVDWSNVTYGQCDSMKARHFPRVQVNLISRKRGSKQLAFYDYKDRWCYDHDQGMWMWENAQVYGYIKSPHENRIAILYCAPWKELGTEPSDVMVEKGITEFTVQEMNCRFIGADLQKGFEQK